MPYILTENDKAILDAMAADDDTEPFDEGDILPPEVYN